METWTLRKQFTFEAAHHLPLHDGKCQRSHGHSWKGWVLVQAHGLVEGGPKQGMVVDYGDISAALKPLIEGQLDHWDLNTTLPIYPTSENLAKYIFDWLMAHAPWAPLFLVGVLIEETCTASAEYRR